jgi:KDO2-lipid IV(A) lauroyltransferase
MKLLYYIIYPLWYLLSLLPLGVLYILSDALFHLLYHLLRYRRRIVHKNLVESFPEKSEAEIRQVERGFYHFFCDYIVESLKMMTISPEEMKRRMVFKGIEQFDEVVEAGGSCALYLGHYCNWEWVSSVPLWVTPKAKCGQIYHPIENPEFDRLFLKQRGRMGAVSIPMNDTLREILRYRSEHQPVIIGYISDQVPHWRNIHHWCDFLHHDTPVLTGTERIVRKVNHAVFYLEMTRVRRGYYEGEIKLITREPQSLPEYEITTRYFQMLEASIRRRPEFWLWSHNRWKRGRAEFNEKFEVINGKVIPKGEEAERLRQLEAERKRKRK